MADARQIQFHAVRQRTGRSSWPAALDTRESKLIPFMTATSSRSMPHFRKQSIIFERFTIVSMMVLVSAILLMAVFFLNLNQAFIMVPETNSKTVTACPELRLATKFKTVPNGALHKNNFYRSAYLGLDEFSVLCSLIPWRIPETPRSLSCLGRRTRSHRFWASISSADRCNQRLMQVCERRLTSGARESGDCGNKTELDAEKLD